MSDNRTSMFGLMADYETKMQSHRPNQRGMAFIKYFLGSWITITGFGFLLGSSELIVGGFLLAIPAVYLYVTRNYPAELSDAQLQKLREDDDVVTFHSEDSQNRRNISTPETSNNELAKTLARTKMRLKKYRMDSLKDVDELIDEIYDDLADLGLYATRRRIKKWTKDIHGDPQ